jgi:LysM repeat protein
MPTRTYSVKKGETIDRISDRFHVTKSSVKRLNPEIGEKEKLYTGQLLVLKSSAPTFGMGIANGYLYPGYRRERFIRVLPYLSYVTICSVTMDGGVISAIFDDTEAIECSKKYSKIPIMRVYTKDKMTDECAKSISLLASSRGYGGVSVPARAFSDDEAALAFKRIMLETGLLLFAERDIQSQGCTEYADVTVLTYDKIHLESIPTFRDGEEKAISEYADRCNPEGSLIDISPFALVGEKYIDKKTVFDYLDRTGGALQYDCERQILTGELGKGKRKRPLVTESLENTVAKLRLVGEYGYLGISFDIMRVPLAELMIYAGMYSEPPMVRSGTVCNPPD